MAAGMGGALGALGGPLYILNIPHKKKSFEPDLLAEEQYTSCTMHNIWVRLNAIIFFGLSVLLAMATMTAISTYWHDSDVEVSKCYVYAI